MNYLVKFKENLVKEIGLKSGDRILLAISGGVDSMLLAQFFLLLKEDVSIDIAGFHLDHMFRGEASYDDYIFVDTYAKNNNFNLYKYRRTIEKISLKSGLGFEETAREKRRLLLEAIAASDGYDYIATAHHASDNAESILMNFIRGASLKGLLGMQFKTGKYIKPLLNFSKDEIYRAAEHHSIEYREDYTNSESIYTRNKIRNTIIPSIEGVNENFSSNIVRSSKLIKDDEAFIESYIDDNLDRFIEFDRKKAVIKVNVLKSYEKSLLRRLILRQFTWFKGSAKDVYSNMILEVEQLVKSGKSGKIKEFHAIRFEYQKGNLIAEPIKNKDLAEVYLEFGLTLFKGYEFTVCKLDEYSDNNFHDEMVYMLRLDDFEREIKLRNRRAGDYIVQKNMTGKKKIKKLFSEMKLTSIQRENTPLLCFNDEVIWVVGKRKGIKHYNALEEFNSSVNRNEQNCKKFIIIVAKQLL